MNRYIKNFVVVLFLLIGLTSCQLNPKVTETDTWKSIVNKEWSGNHGYEGDGFYFYELEDIAYCTYLIYGKDETIMLNRTVEVMIDREGLINMTLQLDIVMEEDLNLVLRYEDEKIGYENDFDKIEDRIEYENTFYTIRYQRNLLEIMDTNNE